MPVPRCFRSCWSLRESDVHPVASDGSAERGAVPASLHAITAAVVDNRGPGWARSRPGNRVFSRRCRPVSIYQSLLTRLALTIVLLGGAIMARFPDAVPADGDRTAVIIKRQ